MYRYVGLSFGGICFELERPGEVKSRSSIFTIRPNRRVVYSGDTCYVTIAAFIVISQSIYSLGG